MFSLIISHTTYFVLLSNFFMSNSKKSICFISRQSHNFLLDKTDKVIGGAEFQQVLLAKSLVTLGWKVFFITEGYSGIDPVKILGINLYSSVDYSTGNRIVRRLFKIPIQIWRLMKKVDADIYYQRNPGPFSYVIGLFCRLHSKRFILAGANDANFDIGNELNVNSFFDSLEIKYGIKSADKIIVQSSNQMELLRNNYHKEGTIFHNLYTPPAHYMPVQWPAEQALRLKILWVGRIAYQKRPELLFKLAKALPEFDFIMVGPSTSQIELANRISFEAKQISNLEYLGHLPIEAVEKLFNSSHALINTSIVEGFPNTYLQAWSRGIPVFSFIDPDNFITDYDLGGCVDSIEEMACSIKKTLQEKESFLKKATKIRSFFDAHFLTHNHIHRFENILLN